MSHPIRRRSGTTRFLTGIAAASTVFGGITLAATAAGAATGTASLNVSFAACGTGSSAAWNTSGDPVLTVGTAPAGTCGQPASVTDPAYAQIDITSAAGQPAPAQAPTFTLASGTVTAGTPRLVITLSNGDMIMDNQTNTLNDANGWEFYNGTKWSADGTYPAALTGAAATTAGVTVTDAYIVEDTSGGTGKSVTVSSITYAGAVLASGTDRVHVNNPGSHAVTEGASFSYSAAATSTKGDAIASYKLSGAPSGLGISHDGVISGPATETGVFTVRVTAADSGGTKGSTTFRLTVKTAPVNRATGTGYVQNYGTGKCLDVPVGNYTPGQALQEWTCGAPWGGIQGADQQFRVATVNGTRYLEAVHGTTVLYVTPTGHNGTAELASSPSAAAAVTITSGLHARYYTFRSAPAAGQVLDVKGGLHSNGTPAVTFGNHAGVTQQWTLP